MAEGHSRRSQRIVRLSDRAADDMALIHTSTAQRWGMAQAERYTEFLKLSIRQTADSAKVGNPVEGRPGLFLLSVKWRGARHGHYIVYKPIDEGALIVRILHSAMDLLNNLSDDIP